MPEEINYSFSEPVELNILAKTPNYNMDATIRNITFGMFERKGQNISFKFENPVEVECAVGKGRLYKMTGNHFFANTFEKTMSLRLGNLTSLHVGEHLGLTLSEEHPLKMLLETNVTSGKILIEKPPKIFNLSLAESIVTLPQIENVSLRETSDLLSSFITSLEQATLNLDKTIREGFINGTLAFSYESDSAPVLVVNLSTDKDNLHWHHGITLKKSNLTLDMKIYLELPKKGTFSFDRGNGLELRYQFEDWPPSFNWISASLEIGNKNLFALLNISGLEIAEGIIKVVEEEQVLPPDGVTPPTVGELNLSVELFLSSIPQELNLTIIRGSNLSLSWGAHSSINSLYLNIIRED
ncbi:MAG: hypothetical protein HY753_04660, partial [Nitrospirae bacterium]|nr:hypothetical protein [Nitrospirota bacterium]